jgi:hypothetical protein
MKNIITILLFSICILSCGQKEETNYKLIATCDKIIVQDTIVNHTTNFLVSFKNLNNKDVSLFTNSYSQNYSDKEYDKIGVFLKFNDSDTPIGQFHPSNKFIIEAGKTLKLLFTYSDKYPNMKIAFNPHESYKSQLKKVKLYYKYDKVLMTKVVGKDENLNYINSDFAIDMSKAVIEFRKDINIEEAIRLVDGKING